MAVAALALLLATAAVLANGVPSQTEPRVPEGDSAEESSPTPSTPAPPGTPPDLHGFCGLFLDCESEMMNIHKKCTDKSRRATGEACGLMTDFKDLNRLMEVRVNEFARCVGNETDKIEAELDEFSNLGLPTEECRAVQIFEMNDVMQKEGCWKAVADAKRRCKVLQRCCPAAKTCMRLGRNSDATKDVRDKHIEINRKTLDCRDRMKVIMKDRTRFNSRLVARAHAVLTAQGDTPMDAIQQKYLFNKNERQQLRRFNKKGRRKHTTTPPTTTTTELLWTAKPTKPQESEVIAKLIYKHNQRTRPPAKPRRLQQQQEQQESTTNVEMMEQMAPMEVRGRGKARVAVTEERLVPLEPPKRQTPSMALRSQQFLEFEQLLADLERERGPTTTKPQKTTPPPPPHTTTTTTTTTTTVEMEEEKEEEVVVSTRPHTPPPHFHWTTPNDRVPLASASSPAPPEYPPRVGIQMFKIKKRPLPERVRPQKLRPPAGNLPSLTGLHQPVSFALPPTVNLTKMNLLAARPKLRAKIRNRSRFHAGNALGGPLAPVPDSFGRGRRARIHSIQTKTSQGKEAPIRKLIPLPEAYVSADGIWTTGPEEHATTTHATHAHRNAGVPEYPDYDAEPTAPPSTQIRSSQDDEARGRVPLPPSPPRGYRNKILASGKFPRRPTTTQTPPLSSLLQLQKQLNPVEPGPLVDEPTPDMERTTMGTLALPTSTTTSPAPLSMPVAHKWTRDEENELMLVKADLVRNLEQYLRNHELKQQERALKSMETHRLALLRKSKEQYDADQVAMTHCQLYATCNDQLKLVQKTCEATNGRLVPGLPKRRFGDCNRKLVSQYKRMDRLKTRIERAYDSCVSQRILNNTAPTIQTCSNEWPVLPEFEHEQSCVHRVRIVQNHCTKLARCCGAVQKCRNAVDESPQSMKLLVKEEQLARASAKCQIRAYNDYRRYKFKHAGDVEVEEASPQVVFPTTTTHTPKPHRHVHMMGRVRAKARTTTTTRAPRGPGAGSLINMGASHHQNRSYNVNLLDTRNFKVLWHN